MTKLHEIEAGKKAVIRKISGDDRFIVRVSSIGLSEGCPLEILQNTRKRPLLIYARDSTIALDRTDCALIEAEVLE